MLEFLPCLQEEMQELNDGLTDELKDKDDQLEHMQRELEDLQGALDARPHPVTTPRSSQTVEPLPAMVSGRAMFPSHSLQDNSVCIV